MKLFSSKGGKTKERKEQEAFYTLGEKPANLNILSKTPNKSSPQKVPIDLSIFSEKKVDNDTASIQSEPVIKKKKVGRPKLSKNKPKIYADEIQTTIGLPVPESPIPQNLSPVRLLRRNPIVAGQSDIDFYKQNKKQIDGLFPEGEDEPVLLKEKHTRRKKSEVGEAKMMGLEDKPTPLIREGLTSMDESQPREIKRNS
jgi:hypothetical protein